MDIVSVLKEASRSYSAPCIRCKQPVLFYPDDLIQNCSDCGALMNNPRPVDAFDAFDPGFAPLRRSRPWRSLDRTSLWLRPPSPMD